MSGVKDLKKLAKTLNKIFTDKAFMEDMSKNCRSVSEMQSVMGQILTYYISTRDTKTYPYEELRGLAYQNMEPKNIKRKESVQEALVRNIIDEGVVTHSFNGFNLARIKKNGLGSDKNYDSVLGAELAKLEKDLGISEYVGQQTNGVSEIYYTSPGANSIYYAMQQSPERLFHGPLNQGKNPLPVLVGEKKEDYYLRVAIDKINRNYRLEEQQPIIDNARKVITKLCSQRPQIALIPITSKKYTLNASLAVEGRGQKTLREYLDHQAGGDMVWWATITFFSDCLGGIHPSNCSDLVSTGVKVPASELEFVSVPDSFEMLQIMARQKGLQPGEKFDLYSLEKVEEKEVEAQQTIAQAPVVEKVEETELNKAKEEIAKNNPTLKQPSTTTPKQHTTTQTSYTYEDEEYSL